MRKIMDIFNFKIFLFRYMNDKRYFQNRSKLRGFIGGGGKKVLLFFGVHSLDMNSDKVEGK